MVIKIELIHGDFFVEFGLLEPELDGILPAVLCLDIGEFFKSKEEVLVFLFGFIEDRVKVLCHSF